MYADYLILLSISIHDLQSMINICEIEFKNIFMLINSKETACLRIGARHNVITKAITVHDQAIEWKQELTYLGLVLVSAKRFKINMQSVKHKFFRAVNSIFGKVGLNTSTELLCSVINTHCIPILMYASEVLSWTKKEVRSMANVYNQGFYKIFRAFDKNIIITCLFYMNILPFDFLVDLRRLNFLDNIKNRVTYDNDDGYEIEFIINKYGYVHNSNRANNWKTEMWKFFHNKVSSIPFV